VISDYNDDLTSVICYTKDNRHFNATLNGPKDASLILSRLSRF
jgi:hypothetical protein